VGSLGAIFSTISYNSINDIHILQLFTGAELAGIKVHGAIDVVISNNHIYKNIRGIWLNWMAQGTRIEANLFHENLLQDLYIEVNHGPFLINNNIFLSKIALLDRSEGGAFTHNLVLGRLKGGGPEERKTPILSTSFHGSYRRGAHRRGKCPIL
jgi:alpha-N-arabinofuranosidase